MGLPDQHISVGHTFGLEFGGIQIRGIAEVSGLKMEQDVIEFKTNGPSGKYIIKKLPGRWRWGRRHADPHTDRRLLDATTYRGVVEVAHAEAFGVAVGTVVDEPSWLARVRRV